MSSKNVQRLPHLRSLRVKSSVIGDRGGPCVVVMSNLLNCWASNAEGAPACAGLEAELKNCMATKKAVVKRKSSVNYHAARLLGRVNPKPHD